MKGNLGKHENKDREEHTERRSGRRGRERRP
jgi:hypothetical protein